MKDIGDLLQSAGIEASLAKKQENADKLFAAWRTINGDLCSEHTEDLKASHGVLHVVMDSQVWLQELLLKDTGAMAREMAQNSGVNIVKIRIKAGGRNKA